MKTLRTNPAPMNPLPVKPEKKRHTTSDVPSTSKRYLTLLTALSLGLSLCLAVLWLFGARPVPLAHAAGIFVNTFVDEDGNGTDCSLREAIIAANTDSTFGGCTTGSGADTISLMGGTYALTITGFNEDAALTGDLDITDTLAINGIGPDMTFIDAAGLGDRVFDIRPGTGQVFISEVTIINGNRSGGQGGGILHAGTDLILNTTYVSSNTAGAGGGVYVTSGQATLSSVEVISNTASEGAGIFVESGRVMLSSGEIASNSGSRGAGVYVSNSSATFTQTGVSTITNNTASQSGGGVYVNQGGATLNGGQILSNTASSGGGVYVNQGRATFTQTGVSTITSNSANFFGGGVHINQGSATLSGGQIISNSTINGGGVYVNQGSATLSGGEVISNTASSGGGVYISQGDVMLSRGQITNNTANSGGGVVVFGASATFIQTGVSTISHNTANDGGGVFVDFGQATLSGGQVVSNTVSSSGGGVYVNDASSAFTQTGTSVIGYNSSGNLGGGLFVVAGQATLSGGQIISNSANSGGGISVFSGQATLSGGEIISNTASQGGGGVWVGTATATFTQTGVSTIAHNTASSSGGGVFISSGQATLSGGEIFSNTATFGGGGVYVASAGSAFTQTGVSAISHNSASGGGGVYVSSGQATLSGGEIISNTATSGGGVYVNNTDASFLQAGDSVIAYNAVNSSGGGMHIASGQATLSSGEISYNTASAGGGVYVDTTNAAFTQTGVSTIAYNTANSGGGVSVNSGQATMSEGQIVSNTATTSNGGGVYISSVSGSFTQTGASIIGYNSANDLGGGMYVIQGSATLSGGQIISNTATNNAGGFYQGAGAISVTNSCIFGNSNTSVVKAGGSTLIATGNWWGAVDGPAGVGPGSGDSVSADVDFSGFLTTPAPACSTSADGIFLPIILKDSAG